MNTYQISYEERNRDVVQSVNVRIRAIGYTIDDSVLTLFDISKSGAKIPIASFTNWNAITDISVVQQ